MSPGLFSDRRLADFCARLHWCLVDANSRVLYVLTNEGRKSERDKALRLAWDYSDINGQLSLSSDQDRERLEREVETIPGTVSYADALALCSKAVESQEVEIIHGGYVQEKRKPIGRRVHRKPLKKTRQAVVCAFTYNGKLWCGVGAVSATQGTCLYRPFGTTGKHPDKQAMAESGKCFSVDVF